MLATMLTWRVKMLITVLIFLHVLTMFAVVTLHSGPQVLIVAARRSQPAAIPGIARAYATSGRLVPPLGILGGLLGLAAALVGGYDLGAPWLLIAYALFLAIIVYGARVSVPFVSALGDTVRDGREHRGRHAGIPAAADLRDRRGDLRSGHRRHGSQAPVMSPVTATGIALILSTLIYHGGLAYLFARSEFGDVLKASQKDKLVIIARHPGEYRRGCRLILLGWIVGGRGVRDARDPPP